MLVLDGFFKTNSQQQNQCSGLLAVAAPVNTPPLLADAAEASLYGRTAHLSAPLNEPKDTLIVKSGSEG